MTSIALTNGYLSEAQTVEIRALLLQAKNAVKLYFTDLTEEDKQGRSMAEGREGLVRLVSKIALANEGSLARNDNASDLANKLDHDAHLETLRQELLNLMEIVTEAQMANGIAAMSMSDRFVKVLQAGRSNNSGLDLALREVDEWNKRFAHSTNKDGKEDTGNNPDQPQA